MGNLYSAERKEQYIKAAVKEVKEMERDEIGFSITEMWDTVISFLLDSHFTHDMAHDMAKQVFRRCGYTVED